MMGSNHCDQSYSPIPTRAVRGPQMDMPHQASPAPTRAKDHDGHEKPQLISLNRYAIYQHLKALLKTLDEMERECPAAKTWLGILQPPVHLPPVTDRNEMITVDEKRYFQQTGELRKAIDVVASKCCGGGKSPAPTKSGVHPAPTRATSSNALELNRKDIQKKLDALLYVLYDIETSCPAARDTTVAKGLEKPIPIAPTIDPNETIVVDTRKYDEQIKLIKRQLTLVGDTCCGKKK